MFHLISTLFLLVNSVALLHASPPPNDDNLVGVWFDPYVGPQDGWNRYNEADTISLLSKVSSRFSTIMAGDIAVPQDCDNPSCSLVHIPTAAATFNKLYRSIGQSPLEVLLQFEDVAKARGTNLSHFDFIHSLAHKANSIYPGTVTTLLFYIKPETRVTLDNAIKVFNSTSEQLSPDKEHLQLGALLPFSYCEQWSRDLVEMLGYVHVVIFEILPSDKELKTGAESTFQQFSQGFEECSKRVKGLNESLQVGYKTGWPDTNGDGVQTIPDFVLFWEKMEKWAKVQKTRVVMHEAFDMPWEYSFEMRSYGWWRLIASRSYSNVSQFMFQEKKEAASKMKNQDIPLKEIDTIDVTTIALGGMAIGLLLLVFLAIAIVILYKRVSSRLMTGHNVHLTSKELEEFFEGNNCGYASEPGTNLNVPGMAYSKDMEIPTGSFTISIEPMLLLTKIAKSMDVESKTRTDLDRTNL